MACAAEQTDEHFGVQRSCCCIRYASEGSWGRGLTVFRWQVQVDHTAYEQTGDGYTVADLTCQLDYQRDIEADAFEERPSRAQGG